MTAGAATPDAPTPEREGWYAATLKGTSGLLCVRVYKEPHERFPDGIFAKHDLQLFPLCDFTWGPNIDDVLAATATSRTVPARDLICLPVEHALSAVDDKVSRARLDARCGRHVDPLLFEIQTDIGRVVDSLVDIATRAIAAARADERARVLPEAMQHCVIVLRTCNVGHSRLLGTNWVDNGCPYCRLAADDAAATSGLDETKPAPGYNVEEFSRGWQAWEQPDVLPSDFGPAGSPGPWPEGERFHATEEEAIAASHRYRKQFVRRDVEAATAVLEGEVLRLREQLASITVPANQLAREREKGYRRFEKEREEWKADAAAATEAATAGLRAEVACLTTENARLESEVAAELLRRIAAEDQTRRLLAATASSERDEFVILDARSAVGNCGSWWAPGGEGYCCNIDEAGRFTREQATKKRDTDIPVPLHLALAYVVRHVRVDQLCRSYDLQPGRKTVEQRMQGREPPPSVPSQQAVPSGPDEFAVSATSQQWLRILVRDEKRVVLEELCRRAVKYAREDRMVTPRVTRLQRVLDEMDALTKADPATDAPPATETSIEMLCRMVKDAGLTMTLYGVPVEGPQQLRAAALDRAAARIADAIIEGARTDDEQEAIELEVDNAVAASRAKHRPPTPWSGARTGPAGPTIAELPVLAVRLLNAANEITHAQHIYPPTALAIDEIRRIAAELRDYWDTENGVPAERDPECACPFGAVIDGEITAEERARSYHVWRYLAESMARHLIATIGLAAVKRAHGCSEGHEQTLWLAEMGTPRMTEMYRERDPEWRDGRCEVGGVTLELHDVSHFAVAVTIDAPDGRVHRLEHHNPDTAKRLGIVLARALAVTP